jgi:hypothetical protein
VSREVDSLMCRICIKKFMVWLRSRWVRLSLAECKGVGGLSGMNGVEVSSVRVGRCGPQPTL